MSLLKTIFGRKEEIITEDLDSYEEEEIKHPHTIEDLISNLNSQEEINRVRNYLDKREREITGDYSLHKPENEKEIKLEEIYEKNFLKKEEEKVEIEFEKNELQNPTKNETVTFQENIEKENSPKNTEKKIEIDEEEYDLDEDFIEFEDDEVKVSEDSFTIKTDLFFQKICQIFGNHNTSKQFIYGRFFAGLGKRDIYQIGIFKSEAFDSNESIEEQNSWFISQIKQLEELKNFKVLNSKDGLKDLIWDVDGKNAIIISFKSVQLLNERKFDFYL